MSDPGHRLSLPRERRGARGTVLVVSTLGLAAVPLHAQSGRVQVTATVIEVTQVREIAAHADGPGRAAIAVPDRHWRITTGRGIEIRIVVDGVLGVPDPPGVMACSLERDVTWVCQLEAIPSRHLRGPGEVLLLGLPALSPEVPRSGALAGLQVTIAYTAN